MRKEEFSSNTTNSSNSTLLNTKKETFVDQFVNWFRNFLESAE